MNSFQLIRTYWFAVDMFLFFNFGVFCKYSFADSKTLLPISWNVFHSYQQPYFIYIWIVLVSRVFTDGLGDGGLITGRVIRKTQKMILDTFNFTITRYVSIVNGSNSDKRILPSLKPRYSSYWKEALSHPRLRSLNFHLLIYPHTHTHARTHTHLYI